MNLPNVIVCIILLWVPSIQRLWFIDVTKLSSLLKLLLLSELFEELLIFELDFLVLLLELFIFQGHPFVIHVEAHHLCL